MIYGTNYLISNNYQAIPSYIKGNRFVLLLRYRKAKRDIGLYELIIAAGSIKRAQLILELISCSLLLYSGPPLGKIGNIAAYPFDEGSKEKPLFNTTTIDNQDCSLLTACQLAAQASYFKSYIYSFNKYYLSCEIHANDWMDLSPEYKYISTSPLPYDHVRYGYAIVIAYSIIEELGLEIRANQNKPSRLIDGSWNPDVRMDIEKRLRRKGIDINEPIIWQLRGPRKNLELNKKVSPLKKTNWALGQIRDCELKIIDAISHVSWIRSKIVSHKVDKSIKSLTIYDVDNAQRLSRRLLLESLGFWNAS